MQLDNLKLGWCKVGPAGAQALTELLMYNQTLSALDLRGNAFGNDGVIVLGRGLRAMVSLSAGGVLRAVFELVHYKLR
eukprot:1161220-Pelagomonas_calceolata.AAC.7